MEDLHLHLHLDLDLERVEMKAGGCGLGRRLVERPTRASSSIRVFVRCLLLLGKDRWSLDWEHDELGHLVFWSKFA